MPFPLAHPSAALLFRRWCPRYLCLPALVIGSLTPDLANCLNWDHFAHSAMGSVVFCLPVGLLILGAFYATRRSLVDALPEPHRGALLPLCDVPRPSFGIGVGSLLIGSWMHLGWDLFTHSHSPVAQQMGVLSVPLPGAWPFSLRLSQALWLISTGGGIMGLGVAYVAFLRRDRVRHSLFPSGQWRRHGFWAVLLVIPAVPALPLARLVSQTHSSFGYTFRAFGEFYWTLLWVTVVLAGFYLRRDRVHPR